MANSEEKDLMGIGRHCAVETCMQLDFLPFTCDCCSRTFCLDHRNYAAHACPDAKSKETEVIVCPVCAKGARPAGGRCPPPPRVHQPAMHGPLAPGPPRADR